MERREIMDEVKWIVYLNRKRIRTIHWDLAQFDLYASAPTLNFVRTESLDIIRHMILEKNLQISKKETKEKKNMSKYSS